MVFKTTVKTSEDKKKTPAIYHLFDGVESVCKGVKGAYQLAAQKHRDRKTGPYIYLGNIAGSVGAPSVGLSDYFGMNLAPALLYGGLDVLSSWSDTVKNSKYTRLAKAVGAGIGGLKTATTIGLSFLNPLALISLPFDATLTYKLGVDTHDAYHRTDNTVRGDLKGVLDDAEKVVDGVYRASVAVIGVGKKASGLLSKLSKNRNTGGIENIVDTPVEVEEEDIGRGAVEVDYVIVENDERDNLRNEDSQIRERLHRADSDIKNISGEVASKYQPFEGEDILFREAAELMIRNKQASVSLLQRKLLIGYTRAAKIVDQLEEKKVIGSYDPSGPREILVNESWFRKD